MPGFCTGNSIKKFLTPFRIIHPEVPKNKQRKFSEINTFTNIVQPGYIYPYTDHPLKGNWAQGFFHNSNPVILEVGCGKGEYSVGLASAWPLQNFVGVDIKGNRMWTGAKHALENAMTNVGFLRIQAEHLSHFFGPHEISGIWITFPDPQPNKPKTHKRLTSPKFLDIYSRFLKPGAPLFLKTDNISLFEYTLDIIEQQGHNLHFATNNLYTNPGDTDQIILNIKTYYENIYLEQGQKILFIKFSL